MQNPFRKDTQRYKVYEKLSDMQWHCTKCDLEAAQAATFRDMKKKGISFDTDDKGNEYKNLFCDTCGVERVHRKLK